LVIITTGKISTREKLKICYIQQNNNLATDGKYLYLDEGRAEKEVAFEELSLRAPWFFPASIIPAKLHTRNSFLYHVRCRYRQTYIRVYCN
jgi:hypothetical protein